MKKWTKEYEMEYWLSHIDNFYLDYVKYKYDKFNVDNIIENEYKDKDISLSIDIGGGKFGGALYFLSNSRKKVLVDLLANEFIKLNTIPKDIEAIKSDVDKLPFVDNSVDIIFVWEILDHVLNKNHFVKAQKEIIRILRKDGLLFFQHPVRSKPTDNHTLILTTNEIMLEFKKLEKITYSEEQRKAKYNFTDETDIYSIMKKI